MSKSLRLLKRIIFSITILLLALYFITWLYFENSIDLVLSKGQQNWLQKEFKIQKKLPEKFYETMEKYIPEFFENNVWNSKINWALFGENKPICQCNEIYLPFIPSENNDNFQVKWVPFSQHDAVVKMYLEDEFSQLDCYTFYMRNSDYGIGINDIESAARHYYNKEIDCLDEKEIIGLFVIRKSPSLYNPTNNTENYENAIKTILKNND